MFDSSIEVAFYSIVMSMERFIRTLPTNLKLATILTFALLFYLFYLFLFTHQPDYMITTTGNPNGNSLQLAVRERSSGNANITVVLLHGQRFDSTTWEGLNTLQILRDAGYRAIALDLPGHGKSQSVVPPKNRHERAVVLENALLALKATDAVIVAPSMSGTYALPLVVRGDLKLKGFVPIAPAAADTFSEVEYSKVTVPTLILYGENDRSMGETSVKWLRNIPNSKIHIFEGAGHACYINSPEEFHKVLVEFLKELSTSNSGSLSIH